MHRLKGGQPVIDTAGWVDPATDTTDNVHPTDAGHAKIAQRLRPILDQYR